MVVSYDYNNNFTVSYNMSAINAVHSEGHKPKVSLVFQASVAKSLELLDTISTLNSYITHLY